MRRDRLPGDAPRLNQRRRPCALTSTATPSRRRADAVWAPSRRRLLRSDRSSPPPSPGDHPGTATSGTSASPRACSRPALPQFAGSTYFRRPEVGRQGAMETGVPLVLTIAKPGDLVSPASVPLKAAAAKVVGAGPGWLGPPSPSAGQRPPPAAQIAVEKTPASRATAGRYSPGLLCTSTDATVRPAPPRGRHCPGLELPGHDARYASANHRRGTVNSSSGRRSSSSS